MKRIIIIGAGVSGLTAALKLKEINKEYDITIIEKENRLGGLITSKEDKNCWFDSGCYLFNKSHILFKKYPHLYCDVESYKCYVWLKKRFFNFPFRIGELLNSVSITMKLKFFLSILIGNLKLKNPKKTANTWLSSRVGSAVMQYTYLNNYIKKLQTLESSKISEYLCQSRLKSLDKSIFSILKNKFHHKTNQNNSPLQYPKGGIIRIINELHRDCISQNIEIIIDSDISEIKRSNQKYIITTESETFSCDYLISSIPLNSFLKVFKSSMFNEITFPIEYTNSLISMFSVKKIAFRNSYLNVYSFEPKFAWKKLTAIKMENDKYSLILESTSSIYHQTNAGSLNGEIKKNLIEDLKLFDYSDIISEDIREIENTYPIFSIETVQNIRKLTYDLHKNHNVIFIGRQATFKYYSAHSTIETTENIICENFC